MEEYNWMHLIYRTEEVDRSPDKPNEAGIVCHVRVYDAREKIALKSCSMPVDHRIEGNDINEISRELVASLNSYTSTDNDREEMLAFIEENRFKIEIGALRLQRSELLDEMFTNGEASVRERLRQRLRENENAIFSRNKMLAHLQNNKILDNILEVATETAGMHKDSIIVCRHKDVGKRIYREHGIRPKTLTVDEVNELKPKNKLLLADVSTDELDEELIHQVVFASQLTGDTIEEIRINREKARQVKQDKQNEQDEQDERRARYKALIKFSICFVLFIFIIFINLVMKGI